LVLGFLTFIVLPTPAHPRAADAHIREIVREVNATAKNRLLDFGLMPLGLSDDVLQDLWLSARRFPCVRLRVLTTYMPSNMCVMRVVKLQLHDSRVRFSDPNDV
jgi:hypothetical protein